MANSLKELKKDEIFAYKYMGEMAETNSEIFFPRIFVAQVASIRNNGIVLKDLVCINDKKASLDSEYAVNFETVYVQFISTGLKGDSLPEKFPEYFV